MNKIIYLLLYIIGALFVMVLAHGGARNSIHGWETLLLHLLAPFVSSLILYFSFRQISIIMLGAEAVLFYYAIRVIRLAKYLREGIAKAFYYSTLGPFFVAFSIGDTEIFGYPHPVKGYRILILKGVKGKPTERPILRYIKGRKKEKYNFEGVTVNIYDGCAKYYSANNKKWLELCGKIGIIDFP